MKLFRLCTILLLTAGLCPRAFAQACLPLKQVCLTSSFGWRVHPVDGGYRFHAGVDLRAHQDTVYAILPGKVAAIGSDPLLGCYIRLDHGEFKSSYGHLSQIFVLRGDSVKAADPIGLSGATGRVTGEHLHFSIQYRGRYVDPLAFLYQILKTNKL